VHSAELVIFILILEACALRDLILSQEVLTKQGGDALRFWQILWAL
jgi:hypothetical protein